MAVSTLEEALWNIGRRLGEQILSGLSRTPAVPAAPQPAVVTAPARRGPGRPKKILDTPTKSTATKSGGCRVPRCARKPEARGLCGSHYGKAQRLKMKLDALTEANLKLLALDGRALRWASKSSSIAKSSSAAKVARVGKVQGRKGPKRK